MPDYRNMTAREAIELAVAVSGKTSKEIARNAGLPTTTIENYRKRQDNYLPSLEIIAPLCRGIGNTVLLQWLEAQFEAEPEVKPAQNRAQVLGDVARANAILGEAQKILADSEEKGIDPVCAREIRSKLDEVIAQCRHTKAMLAQLAGYRNRLDVPPLASLKREKMRWWKLWLQGWN